MLGWEEVARAPIHRTTLVQHWHDPQLARAAVARGAKLVLSPATKTYLDMKYTRSSALGLTWAGTTSVRAAYDWDPATLVDGVEERDVAGVEAPLWSETISTRAGLDHLAFPRLLGVAEIGWSPAEGRSWREYRRASPRRARASTPSGSRSTASDALAVTVAVAQRRPVTEPRPVFSSARGARAPVAAAGLPRLVHGVEQLVCVRAALLAEEVGRGRALADELDIDVLPPDEDVAQEAAVPVPVVELRIGGERHTRPLRRERDERLERGAPVAVGLELGRIDLERDAPSRRSSASACRRR